MSKIEVDHDHARVVAEDGTIECNPENNQMLDVSFERFSEKLFRYHPPTFPASVRWISHMRPSSFLVERPAQHLVLRDEFNKLTNITRGIYLPWRLYFATPVSTDHFQCSVFCRTNEAYTLADELFVFPSLHVRSEDGVIMNMNREPLLFSYGGNFLSHALTYLESKIGTIDSTLLNDEEKISTIRRDVPSTWGEHESIASVYEYWGKLAPEEVMFETSFTSHEKFKTIRDVIDSRDTTLEKPYNIFSYDEMFETIMELTKT